MASYFPYSFIGFPIVMFVLVSSIYSLLMENPIALLPLYFYLLAVLLIQVVTAIFVFFISIWDNQYFMHLIGYDYVKNIFYRIALLLIIKFFIFFNICILWWQIEVVFACKKYFEDKADQINYVHLSVPESFLDAKIGESIPINKGITVPDYVIYTLGEDKTSLMDEPETPKKSLE
ncbi:hypothetical protein FO519_005174 [Halicephalobus sp. NKZ332]|nr:hypothetical protein FO519_005174 [Halicephalobus sp. NKZ332]